MKSYTEPTGSRPPETRLIPTDKDEEGKRNSLTVCVCVFQRERVAERKQGREGAREEKVESRTETVLFTV